MKALMPKKAHEFSLIRCFLTLSGFDNYYVDRSFSSTHLSDTLLSLSIITFDRNIVMKAERKIFISAAMYGILGLVAGFFG